VGTPLICLDSLPVESLVSGRFNQGVSKDMRMTPLHFIAHRCHHVAKGKMPDLVRHVRVIHDLKKQIAEFLLERYHVAGGDGFGNLVGLLYGVGRNRRKILLDIPRTTLGGMSQLRHDVEKPLDSGGILRHGSIIEDQAQGRKRVAGTAVAIACVSYRSKCTIEKPTP